MLMGFNYSGCKKNCKNEAVTSIQNQNLSIFKDGHLTGIVSDVSTKYFLQI